MTFKNRITIFCFIGRLFFQVARPGRVLCPCNVKHTDQRYAFETYVNLSRKSVKKDVGKMSSLLLNSKKPVVQFEDKWHELKPTVNKLLKQQAVTTQEWQNLFW